MVTRFSRFVLCAALVLSAFRAEAYLQELSPESFNALYNLAAKGNVSAINNARSRGLNIDSVNANGDTGLCVAAKNRNRQAFKAFLQAGANPYHSCTWEVNGYQNFMKSVIINPVKNMDTAVAANKGAFAGMSFTTKALIGAGVVAAGAGTAVALSGGGGGGDDAKSCQHGHYVDGACVCDTGYEHYYKGNCYVPLNCNAEHGQQQGTKCVCDTGYNDGDLCNNCGPGYGRNAAGDCVRQKVDLLGNPTDYMGRYININYNSDGNIILNSNTYEHVYGLYYDAGNNYGERGPAQTDFANAYAHLAYDDEPAGEGEDEVHHVIGDLSHEINITKAGDGQVYGMYSAAAQNLYNNYFVVDNGIVQGVTASAINITSTGNGNVYGMFGNGNIYNAYFESAAEIGDKYYSDITISADIDVSSSGSGNVYGMYNGSTTGTIYNRDDSVSKSKDTEASYLIGYGTHRCYAYEGSVTCTLVSATSSVISSNTGSGNAYGLYSLGAIENNTDVTVNANSGNAYAFFGATGFTNSGTGDATSDTGTSYGLYVAGNGTYSNQGSLYSTITSEGTGYGIYAPVGGNIYNVGQIIVSNVTGNSYGMYAKNAQINNSWGTSPGTLIAMTTTGDAYGIKSEGTDSSITNSAAVMAVTSNGNAYGIYNVGGTVVNSADFPDQSVYVNNTGSSGIACGIYSDGGSVTNTGRIDVYGGDGVTTYGIWAKNHAMVTLDGSFTIAINGNSLDRDNYTGFCSGTGCTTPIGDKAIYLEGGSTLTIVGTLNALSPLNMGLQGVFLGTTGQISAPSMGGNLSVVSSAVSNGFNQTYTLPDAINTEDSSNLNLLSQSSLFDAHLNGTDVVLTKKDFADVVDGNASVAAFLEKNYALKNNESLYALLKEKTSLHALNQAVKQLTGSDVLSRFNTEDLLMEKELGFDVSQKMADVKDNYFSFSGTSSPQIFANGGVKSRYALSGAKTGKTNIGVGLFISDVRTDDGSHKNDRVSRSFNFMMPIETRYENMRFLINPKMGYAFGTYRRSGYAGKEYEGKIEKRMAGVAGQIKYPFGVGGFEFAPVIDTNVAVYQTKLKENAQVYSLYAPRSEAYSVETGVGAYISTQREISKTQKWQFMTGALLYHEFADPNKLTLSMNGMEGHFKLTDDNRSKNYVVLRSKASFDFGNVSVYGGFLSYVDKQCRARADIGLKYAF